MKLGSDWSSPALVGSGPGLVFDNFKVTKSTIYFINSQAYYKLSGPKTLLWW